MEQTGEVGIKIYTSSKTDQEATSFSSSSTTEPPPPSKEPGKKSRAVAKGVQNTLSKTSVLVNFLTRAANALMLLILILLIGLCAVSCFFHFTDSFKGSDGKVYYGFVTPKGLAVFKPGLVAEVPNDERYKVGISDFVPAIMLWCSWPLRFPIIGVTHCLFPNHVKEME